MMKNMQSDNPFEQDMLYRYQPHDIYCLKCGKMIIDEPDEQNKYHYPFEVSTHMHYKCYSLFIKEQKEKEEKQKVSSEADWTALKDKYLKDRR